MLAMIADGESRNPPASRPSANERAPEPPAIASRIAAPKNSPRWSTPNMSSTYSPPIQVAMNCSRCCSLAASNLARHTLVVIVAMKLPVVVAFDTPAGHAACTTLPSRVRTSIARCRPAGDHGMSKHRYGRIAAIVAPTHAGRVQLITAGAWSAVSPKSNDERSRRASSPPRRSGRRLARTRCSRGVSTCRRAARAAGHGSAPR